MIKFKVQRAMLGAKLKGTHTKWGIIKIYFSTGGFCGSKTESEEIQLQKRIYWKSPGPPFLPSVMGVVTMCLALLLPFPTCYFLSNPFCRYNSMSFPPGNNSPIVPLHRNSSRGAPSLRVAGKPRPTNPRKTPPRNLYKSGFLEDSHHFLRFFPTWHLLEEAVFIFCMGWSQLPRHFPFLSLQDLPFWRQSHPFLLPYGLLPRQFKAL